MANAAFDFIPDEAPRTTLYDSSDPGGVGSLSRTGRGRSVSISSSVSASQSSTSSCSLSSLDSDEIRNIFNIYQNVTVSGNKIHSPTASPSHHEHLVFGVRPWKQRAAQLSRAPSITLDEQLNLNPKAAPFVPGGRSGGLRSRAPVHEVPYYDEDSEDDMGVTYYPERTDQHLQLPPGLSAPSGQRTPTNGLQTFENPAAYEQQSTMPRWLPFFSAGTSLEAAFDPHMFKLNANALMTSLPHWTDEELQFFASQFPGKAYSSVEGCEYPVAKFAFAVYTAFAAMLGEMTAQAFLWNLRQQSVYAFMTSWSTESLDASLYTGSGLTGHVLSSIFLSRFIGDLFNQGLLAKEHIAACISKLLENPISEEHVAALGHLVSQAGPELWMAEPMVLDVNEFETFMVKLERAVASVRMTLVENNSQPPGYCRIWLEKVKGHFEGWRQYYNEDLSEYPW